MRSQSRWCWVSVLALLLAGVSGVGAQQEQQNYGSTLTSLSVTLRTALSEHETQQRELNNLRLIYARLLSLSREQSNELALLRADNERLQAQLSAAHLNSIELSDEASQLVTSLDAQSTSFRNYRQESEAQMRHLRRSRWVWITLAAIAGVAVGAAL